MGNWGDPRGILWQTGMHPRITSGGWDIYLLTLILHWLGDTLGEWTPLHFWGVPSCGWVKSWGARKIPQEGRKQQGEKSTGTLCCRLRWAQVGRGPVGVASPVILTLTLYMCLLYVRKWLSTGHTLGLHTDPMKHQLLLCPFARRRKQPYRVK